MLGTYILIMSPVIGNSSAHYTLIAAWAPETKHRTLNTVKGYSAADWSDSQLWYYSIHKMSHLCCMLPLAVTVMNAGESSMASKNSASSFSSLASPCWDRSTPTATNTGQGDRIAHSKCVLNEHVTLSTKKMSVISMIKVHHYYWPEEGLILIL